MIDTELVLVSLDSASKVRAPISCKFSDDVLLNGVTSEIVVNFTAGRVIGTHRKIFWKMFFADNGFRRFIGRWTNLLLEVLFVEFQDPHVVETCVVLRCEYFDVSLPMFCSRLCEAWSCHLSVNWL